VNFLKGSIMAKVFEDLPENLPFLNEAVRLGGVYSEWKSVHYAYEPARRLDDLMCCSGHDCGCRASTNRDWLIYNINAAIAKATGKEV
jgi:hypothetical protein